MASEGDDNGTSGRFLDKCKTYFGTDDLYEVLGVKKSAKPNEIKKGYHRVSLKVHPDRVGLHQQSSATAQFQTLGRIYSILSDVDRRAVYDETGCVDSNDDLVGADGQTRDWAEYWRLLFKPLTVRDIEQFEKEYVDSAEEREDLVRAYELAAGDMTAILERVPCASEESEPRLRAILQQLIESGRLQPLDAFVNECGKKKSARKRRARAEAVEAEQMKRELGLTDSDNSLQALIQSRQNARGAQMNSFFENLEAKYAKPSRKKRST